MKPSLNPDDLYLEAAKEFALSMQRLARSTEANAARRQDLLQDMHFELWRSFSAFNERCSLKTWVYRVIHNVAASHVGREKRRPCEIVDLSDIDQMPSVENLTSEVDQSIALAKLHEWIRGLKTTDRQVITLYLEGLSANEIADVTGLKPGSIATRISRMKSRLTQHFNEAAQ